MNATGISRWPALMQDIPEALKEISEALVIGLLAPRSPYVLSAVPRVASSCIAGT